MQARLKGQALIRVPNMERPQQRPIRNGSCLLACLLASPSTMLTDWGSWVLSSLEQYFMRSLFY